MEKLNFLDFIHTAIAGELLRARTLYPSIKIFLANNPQNIIQEAAL